MFEGFTRTEIKTRGARIVTVHGGKGPPLLLMHGNPFTHVSWHKVAPRLASEFTVVATDLRGYGDSEKPPGGEDHTGYSFRAMAQDQVEVMAALGFDRFYAAGHDRGARVLHRMCLDHPGQGRARRDPRHHPAAPPAQQRDAPVGHLLLALVLHDPALRLSRAADGRRPGLFHRQEACPRPKQGLSFFDPAALAEYKRCFRNPATIHAMCEDYRATHGVDLAMDTEDFAAGRKIACPVLLLWGATGGVGRNHKSMEIWPRYAADIRGGKALPCGHYLAEEAPEETYRELREFFAAGEPGKA